MAVVPQLHSLPNQSNVQAQLSVWEEEETNDFDDLALNITESQPLSLKTLDVPLYDDDVDFNLEAASSDNEDEATAPEVRQFFRSSYFPSDYFFFMLPGKCDTLPASLKTGYRTQRRDYAQHGQSWSRARNRCAACHHR